MKTMDRVNTFTEHHPFMGPAFWIVSVQYFVVQIIAAIAYSGHYSLLHNTISDLGNTVCGMYSDRYVCSPQHGLMNLSFVILGITMIAGSLLISQGFRRNIGSVVGFSAMALAGLGSILVGIFPENGIGWLHFLGAALAFLIGNLGMVILGFSLELPKILKYYSILSGTISLMALVLFVSDTYLGIGIGGMERIVAYPQTVWLIVFGIYVSRDRMRSEQHHSS